MWHFIIGVDIIKNILIYIIISILFFSCAGKTKLGKRSKDRVKSNISIKTQYWNTTNDSLNFYVHISIPINQFVFKKQVDHFSSEINFTLVISDAEGNKQYYRESWKEELSEPYYENTRDSDNLVNTEKHIVLLPGDYKLFLNVQDEDSRRNMKKTKNFTISGVEYISPSLLFSEDDQGQLKQIDYMIQKLDTIWLRTQVNFPNNKIFEGPVSEGGGIFNLIMKLNILFTTINQLLIRDWYHFPEVK